MKREEQEKTNFSFVLRRLRKGASLTQGELAEHLNYGYTAISNYESGRNEPSIRDLIKIAEFFNVSLDYLVRGREVYKINSRASDVMLNFSRLREEGKKQVESIITIFLFYQRMIAMKDKTLEATKIRP